MVLGLLSIELFDLEFKVVIIQVVCVNTCVQNPPCNVKEFFSMILLYVQQKQP